jgi:hypothetical protein
MEASASKPAGNCSSIRRRGSNLGLVMARILAGRFRCTVSLVLPDGVASSAVFRYATTARIGSRTAGSVGDLHTAWVFNSVR